MIQRERWSGKRAADLDSGEQPRASSGGCGPGPDGTMTGRNPRRRSPDELEAMGHQRMLAQEAGRLKCLDCCAGNSHEVRLGVAVACPSWAFHMGKSPWRPKPSAERHAMLRESARRMNSGAPKHGKSMPQDAERVGWYR